MSMMTTIRDAYKAVKSRVRNKKEDHEKESSESIDDKVEGIDPNESSGERRVRYDELDRIIERYWALNMDSNDIIRNLRALMNNDNMNKFSDDELSYLAKRFEEKAMVCKEAYNDPTEMYYREAHLTAMYYQTAANKIHDRVCFREWTQ